MIQKSSSEKYEMIQTRFVGLTHEAQRAVSQLKKPKPSPDRFFIGWDCDHLYMMDYMNRDGEVTFEEVYQLKLWLEGPVVFTCLRDSECKILYEWSKGEDMGNLTVDFEKGIFNRKHFGEEEDV